MARFPCALLTAIAVTVLSFEHGMAVPSGDGDDAVKIRCTSRSDGCSGHGDCTASGSCACDPHYEGARCDVWRSSNGATTSLAGLVNLKWHNCTHDADMKQRCARSNSTICERAGAPTVPSCEGGVAEYEYGVPGQHMSSENPRACGCRPDPGQPSPGPTVVAFPTVVHGVAGAYCAPECNGGDGAPNTCPNATGKVHAQPMCIARPCEMMAESYVAAVAGLRTKTPGCNFSVCALACDPSIPQDPPPVPPGQPNPGYPNCPSGMTCKPVPDADFSPPSAPPSPGPGPPPGPQPSPQCELGLATYCGGQRSSKMQCNECLLQYAQELRNANCTIEQEVQYCDTVAPPPPPGPSYASYTGICTYDWQYIWANQPTKTFSPQAIQLDPLEMVPADIKCGYKPPPVHNTSKVYSCSKSTGCSPGVCDACCNDYITGAACQQCVADQCTEAASCDLPVPPKLKGNDCTPGPGFPNCTEGVCSACCSATIDPKTCDMCVERLCQIPDRGLPTCHTCQNRCSEGCKPDKPPPTPPPPPPPTPPAPPPPPSPPPPLSSSPCIRFLHAIPVAANIDVMITQETGKGPAISYNWTNYAFGQHSNWVNVFEPGVGSITFWENVNGVTGKMLYHLDHIPLTPGPLVVALKVAQDQDPTDPSKYWPPVEADQVETIAASYVPQKNDSASVRLFNLSPDTKIAGMTSSAKGGTDITQVKYGLASDWSPFPIGGQTFQFFDDDASPPKMLMQAAGNLTGPPIGETQFLLGLQDPQAPAAVKLTSLLLMDAPEGGLCKPTA